MKKSIQIIYILFFMLLPLHYAAADEVQISAEIIDNCELSVPEMVQIDDIMSSELAGKPVDAQLRDYMKSITITTSCHGSEYQLTFFRGVQANNSGCIGDATGLLRFCLETADGTALDFDQYTNEAYYTGTDEQLVDWPHRSPDLSPLLK